MYCSLTQVESRVPHDLVVQALDDNRDGQIDGEVLLAWEQSVDGEIDGILGQRYAVPFTAVPAVVASAALILRCEALYQRRGVATDQNPFASQASDIRKKLDRIGRGADPLTPDTAKARPSGTIISEPSRLSTVYPGDSTEATHAQRLLN